MFSCLYIRPSRFFVIIILVAAFAIHAHAGQADDESSPLPPVEATPTAQEVIQRHIDAIGGEEAIRRHSMRTRTGTMKVADLDIEGEITIYTAAPDNFLMVANLGEHGVNRAGFNGSLAWTMDQINGPRLLKEAQFEELRRQADFYADVRYEQNYRSMENRGAMQFQGMPVYELKLIDRSGKDVFAYFSIESGLQVGLKGELEAHAGPVPATTLFAEYKSFDGILLPTRLQTTFMDIEQVITITRVSHEMIDEDVFDLPEEIVALHEQENLKGDEPDSDEEVEQAEPRRADEARDDIVPLSREGRRTRIR